MSLEVKTEPSTSLEHQTRDSQELKTDFGLHHQHLSSPLGPQSLGIHPGTLAQ